MLPFVVVVDLGKSVHCTRHDVQLVGRHRHDSQRTGANTLWRKNRPYPGNPPFSTQLLKHAQQHVFGNTQPPCQLGKGGRADGKILLIIVQQTGGERGIG